MDKRKEEIIEIAIRRFSHYGFSKTTMNEVADDLKITKANLYYYYPDKIALIKDVVMYISTSLFEEEKTVLGGYKGDLISSLHALLKIRAEYMRKYYVLYINENLDWIRDVGFTEIIENLECKGKETLYNLLTLAVEDGSLRLEHIADPASLLRDIFKGLTLNHTLKDVICNIPNVQNVDDILDSQMKAVKLIFEERLVTNK